ncbi:flavodoxin family protein [Adlercreutzia sp. R25]|uniref:flavodoxin family protein n=1 Tax=Adlercreutzia shanghongiae TaxID=3111773 RepID=UPI002DBE43F6|nr:flavodoxin family protein [Adlercreutzia sp. R25]MEC4272909.1 flavodoxin family protein [Adlercreutzia sp. R25]
MHRVILHGSCRADGRSAALADELFNACIEECPDDGVSIVSVSSAEVRPCIGCDKCRAVSEEPIHVFQEGDPLLPQEAVVETDALFHHCIIDDDMNEVRKHLDAADELIVVCPVYFASVPAQMKALLDRLQPYYFTDLRTRPKRPAVIHVVGEGGDPHGFEPLIGTVRSALSVAGFSVELVLDWVGKIRADGEITADAEEYPLPPVGGFGALGFGGDYECIEVADGDAPVDGAFADGAFAGEPEDELGDGADDGFEDFVVAERACRSDGRAKLSVSQKPARPKEGAESGRHAGGRGKGPRKPSKSGGPAYGKKNTKKKGNGRGGRR